MDNEQERQRRDLQRAIELLETMPREEIVEMLLDILSNERSDYTRKLSDWMAFQIILHNDTRRERELLAQLGKGGRNNQRSQTSETPSVSPHCPTCAVQSSKSQVDSLTESSSSTGSFATCPEAEPAKVIQTNDNVAHDGALVEVPAISGTLANATVTQIDERPDFGDILTASESEEKGPRRFRAKLTSWLLQRRDTTLLRKQQAPSESITSSEDPQPKDSVILVKSGAQPVTGHDSVASMILPRGSDEIRQKFARVKATSAANALGHKNLAELYARYARVQEGSNGACDEYEDNDASTSDLDASERRQWLEKMQCEYCRLYFTHEQNVRDLDNGSSPCSYHPGTASRNTSHTQDLKIQDNDDLIGNALWKDVGVGAPAWTCCDRGISLEDFVSGPPKKSPGCVNGYHSNLKEFRCCLCEQLFTEEMNGFQLDGSPPCSYHPVLQCLMQYLAKCGLAAEQLWILRTDDGTGASPHGDRAARDFTICGGEKP